MLAMICISLYSYNVGNKVIRNGYMYNIKIILLLSLLLVAYFGRKRIIRSLQTILSQNTISFFRIQFLNFMK